MNKLNKLNNINNILARLTSNFACVSGTNSIFYYDLGIIDYNDAYRLQISTFELVKQNNYPGILFFLEHTPVITVGSNRNLKNLLTDERTLKEKGIELVQSTRGGDITLHAPGQLVCYPILNLEIIGKDLTTYVYNLEQVIINTLNHYNIFSVRVSGHRGIFVKHEKIASVGIRVKKWTTIHGFSVNVNVDLSYFNNIIACGLKDYPQISMQKILKNTLNIKDVKDQIIKDFSEVFRYPLKNIE